MTWLGVDFLEAISAAATSIGNVGPGIASIGPSGSFFHLPDASKWVLSFLMLMGRLELFTIAILFTPYQVEELESEEEDSVELLLLLELLLLEDESISVPTTAISN